MDSKQNKPKKLNTKRDTPITPKVLEKYDVGAGPKLKRIKTRTKKKLIQKKEHIVKFAAEQAARAELLLEETDGYLEPDVGERTTQFTQTDIAKNVDITAASKHFELHLNNFGPYRCKYFKNGRHLLLGGKKGHVAALDWLTKKLVCEMNVMESVSDISWLHLETMFAVAQKNWVYIYDNQGIELHCLKQMYNVCRMEFLPYHFLLATLSDSGFLSWLDISIGKIVSHYNTKHGKLSLMTQNPWNATLCVGQPNGIVSMWAPKVHEPLAKLLCHKAPLSSLQITRDGKYMATAAMDKSLKIWDVRNLAGPVQNYKLRTPCSNMSFSQRNVLALGLGNVVEIFKDCCATTAKRAYLRNRFNNHISSLSFCPHEDVLGVGTEKSFASLLVPGSGEPNYDALEANPFQTKSQRKESEVKALLDKIPADLISLDPTIIAEVDVTTLKSKIDAKMKLKHVKPPKISYVSKKKKGKKGGKSKSEEGVQKAKDKKEQAVKAIVNNVKKVSKKGSSEEFGLLQRFIK